MTPFWNDNGTMQFFEVGQFDWQKDNKAFVQEASMLGIGTPATTLIIKNPKTGNLKSFKMCGIDRDAEEIYGWRYKTNDGLKALIIND